MMPCVTLLGFLAWGYIFGNHRVVAALLCILSLGLSVTSGALVVYPVTRDFSRGLRPALVPLSLYIRDDTSVSAEVRKCVAALDIGVVGYYSDARIVDLGELIAPRIQQLSEQNGYNEILRTGAFLELGPVHYVIDRSDVPERFRDHITRGLRWVPLQTTQLANLGIMSPGPYYYTLYALQKSPEDSL